MADRLMRWMRGALAGASASGVAAVLLAAGASASRAARDSPVAGGLTSFQEYSPLSTNTEMARRLLRPLMAATLPLRLATLHKQLSEQPIDLGREHFLVRLPAARPPSGYGLIVFVPASEDASLPVGWGPVLDRLGLIFVSAERSGNDASPLGRRIPLAILAAYNVMARYPVDPARTIISGFSGGSRVALRIAIGYPDLFRAAILDAGSDPVGGDDMPLPTRTLFDQFRLHSRLVYVTGTDDALHLEQASASAGSLQRWCVSDVGRRTIAGLDHDVMPGSGLADAIGDLATPRNAARARRDAQCWQSLTATIDARLSAAAVEAAHGKTADAIDHLKAIDRDFAGLAAPGSIDLARQLGLLDKPS